MKLLLILSLLANLALGTLYYQEHKEVTALQAYHDAAEKLLKSTGTVMDKAADTMKEASKVIDKLSKEQGK